MNVCRISSRSAFSLFVYVHDHNWLSRTGLGFLLATDVLLCLLLCLLVGSILFDYLKFFLVLIIKQPLEFIPSPLSVVDTLDQRGYRKFGEGYSVLFIEVCRVNLFPIIRLELFQCLRQVCCLLVKQINQLVDLLQGVKFFQSQCRHTDFAAIVLFGPLQNCKQLLTADKGSHVDVLPSKLHAVCGLATHSSCLHLRTR